MSIVVPCTEAMVGVVVVVGMVNGHRRGGRGGV